MTAWRKRVITDMVIESSLATDGLARARPILADSYECTDAVVADAVGTDAVTADVIDAVKMDAVIADVMTSKWIQSSKMQSSLTQ